MKLHSFDCCFTKHDLFTKSDFIESIEVVLFSGGVSFVSSALEVYFTSSLLSTSEEVSMLRCRSVSMVAESL